jgi:hypothetical protein
MTIAWWVSILTSVAGILTAVAALLHSIVTRQQVTSQAEQSGKTTSTARHVQIRRSDLG